MGTKHDDPCLKKAADDEPLFVLRATDSTAPTVVCLWILLAGTMGAPTWKLEEARQLVRRMHDWQREHGCKVPD